MTVSPHLQALRACQDRMFDREGIPMYLTLVSEVAPVPDADDEARSEGAAVAAAMDAYRAGLLPSQRDGDLGALVSVLQAVAHVDLYTAPDADPPAAGPVEPVSPGPAALGAGA